MQLQRFLSATEALQAQGIQLGIRHIANSCAALRFPETRLDAVRIGSGLVGALGAPVPVSLKRDVIFTAQVVAIKQLEAGDTTGYASLYKAKKQMKAAVVAIGSQCGFGMNPYPDTCRFRDLLSAVKLAVQQFLHPPVVEFEGKPLKLIGRIGSQYTLFDATGTQLQAGQEVTAKVSLLFPVQRRVIR
jgi:alanine racemase